MIHSFASRALFGALLLLGVACADGAEQCLGTAVACSERSVAQCTDGCSLSAGCNGGAISCESLTDNGSRLCNQTSGCTWVGQCDGVAGCSDRAFDECEEQEGCNEVRRCYGDGATCEGTGSEQCELYPQCALNSICSGSAMSCEALGSTAQCNTVPGCYAADTSPAVLN